MDRFVAFVDSVGRRMLAYVEEMGHILLLFLSALSWMVRPPLKSRLIFKQMEFVGVKSIVVVVLTGTFTGMVLALQSYHGFRLFSAESLVGSTVALGMTRELGPVLTSLMVTARAGSAMAAELGTMRVTEQIDALYVMAANPVKHLIVPRILASVVMVPLLTVVSDFMGILGGYFVGVQLLFINEGAFLKNITKLVELDDIYNGLIKAACFGLILSVVGCYKGFNTKGGAEGVGRATTEAVVLSSISILISDYFLTAIMF
ncbi:MAG: putative phospholipid ABC transporter permease protein MlaE [Syntrophaceae bacterium PtaU1.Bin231]|nr:MAG: putative phospholipid ABC transporter permease protein MlaE [Syntrophaceae bacterium PtaU1.Bin231]HOG16198.1 ABC transporter permease [Syntrophales bacterium]